MIKQIAALLTIFVLLISATACQKNQSSTEPSATGQPSPSAKTESSAQQSASPRPSASVSPQPSSSDEQQANGKIKLAESGRVDTLPFGIGAATGDILKKLGEPDSRDYFEGGLYFAYQQNVFFTSAALDNDGKLIAGHVVGLGFREGAELFGVKVGMKFADIVDTLGKPDQLKSSRDNADNQLYGELWSMTYNAGGYQLIFVADTQEGATIGAYLWKKTDDNI